MNTTSYKKIAIILNGHIKNHNLFLDKINNFKYLAGADGGCKHILNYNLLNKVLFVAGDFDSFKNPEKYFKKEIIYKFDTEKDFTDSYGTYKIAKIEYNFKEFHFFACSGKREDHFLSLIFSFCNRNFIKSKDIIYFHTDYETFTLLRPGNYKFNKLNYQFSLFPLLPVKKLQMRGTKYKFKTQNLSLTGQGVSNIFINQNSTISFKNGLILLSILEQE